MATIPGSLNPHLATLARTAQEQGKTLGKLVQGVKGGAITPKEAGKLLQGQAKLAEATASALSDGEVSLGEELGLLKQNLENLKNVKAAFENNTQDAFTSQEAAPVRQVQQVAAIAEGLLQGSITPREAAPLLKAQSALASARAESATPEDLALLDMSEELLGQEIDLAKLTDSSGK